MDLSMYTPDSWCKNEEAYLEHLKSDLWDSIPLVNVNDLENLKDGTLVRFRGMVQDMYNPEYYYERYEVVNEQTYGKYLKNGKYLDAAKCLDQEVINIESTDNVTSERQTMFVVSVPAINSWVTDIDECKYRLPPKTSEMVVTSSDNNLKRNVEIAEAMDCDNTETEVKNESSAKKMCSENKTQSSETSTVSKEYLLNFPLPDKMGKACHIKIYKDKEALELNSLCEFVGFLSTSPYLSCSSDNADDNEIEEQTHNPPPSLIPRIHCVSWKRLEHNNPLLPGSKHLQSEKIKHIKKELQILLTQLLLGDDLAAEFLLFHLMSEVYLRKDFMALGKFSLNISNVPLMEEDFVKTIYKFIELLVPKSYYFAMTLENMNDLVFTPKKDYASNRLTSGILQLTSNTHFLVDETKLKPGKLNEAGVKNLSSIAKAIKSQKVLYNFGFYELDFNCDIPFLIMSEGKSMLPCDFHVPLKPDETHVNTFKEISEAARHFLNPELLNDIRIYLTLARKGEYDIADNVHELVQKEFVEMRKTDISVTGDNLHQLLVLARLVSLSEGQTSLDEACWKKACALESERKSRLRK